MIGGEKKFKNRRASHSTSGKVSLKVRVKKAEAKKISRAHMVEAGNSEKIADRKMKELPRMFRRKERIDESEKEAVENIFEQAEEIEAKNMMLAAKVEQQKKIIMWSGVAFFMILIGSLWIYNARQILKPVGNESGSDLSGLQFNAIGDELTDKMKEMKDSLQSINEFMKDKASSTDATTTAENAVKDALNGLVKNDISSTTGATSTGSINQLELDELKQKLDELEKKLKKNN